MSSKIDASNIIEGRRKRTLNSDYFNEVTINPGINIDAIMDKKKATCHIDEVRHIMSANAEANKMESMDVDQLSDYLNSIKLGGGKKKKGGNLTLFLPLAILLAKDTTKAIRAMSNLGIDYIYSWFDFMNRLTSCFKYIYDKAMYDIYPSLIYMYHDLKMDEVAPFIMNNGPIYFNYVIQKLGEAEQKIINEIDRRKIAELKTQYQEMKSRFEKGNEDNKIITNEIIQERLKLLGEKKTQMDADIRANQTQVKEEQELAKVEEAISELEKQRLENTQATINAILEAEQEQIEQRKEQKITQEFIQMLLEDEASRQLKRKPTGNKRGLDQKTEQRKRQYAATNRSKSARETTLNERRGIGGKRNTKKHYNKKKNTKKHPKKLHRKTKRG